MKKFIIFFLMSGYIINIYAKEDPEILKIRNLYQKWQPYINSNLNNGIKFYLYLSGERFEIETWSDKKLNNEDLFLHCMVTCLENKDLGYFIYREYFTPSGDWFITQENYYSPDGFLYFIFWKMNSYQANPPVTVEKRLYFNNSQKLIRELKNVYKMNTKEKVEATYNDREVEYEIKINKLGFYRYWKK